MPLNGQCAECGGRTWTPAVTRCKRCYWRSMRGAGNHQWCKFKGDTPKRGWDRALRRFKLGACQRCRTAAARDRHHKDGDPTNNSPANVRRLCRRCHMIEDGRLSRMAAIAETGRKAMKS